MELLAAASPRMTQQTGWLAPPELTHGGQQQHCTAADSTTDTRSTEHTTPATLWSGGGHNIGPYGEAGKEGATAQTDADMKAQPPESDGRGSRCCRGKDG